MQYLHRSITSLSPAVRDDEWIWEYDVSDEQKCPRLNIRLLDNRNVIKYAEYFLWNTLNNSWINNCNINIHHNTTQYSAGGPVTCCCGKMLFVPEAKMMHPTLTHRHRGWVEKYLWFQDAESMIESQALITKQILNTGTNTQHNILLLAFTPSTSHLRGWLSDLAVGGSALEVETNLREDWSFKITEKVSWLKVPTSNFTFKTLLRHYDKRASLMTFESATQFHVNLLWVNKNLVLKCLNSVLKVKVLVCP